MVQKAPQSQLSIGQSTKIPQKGTAQNTSWMGGPMQAEAFVTITARGSFISFPSRNLWQFVREAFPAQKIGAFAATNVG